MTRRSIAVLLLLPGLLALPAAGRSAMPSPAAASTDPFEGIEDAKVLPMLKHLPHRHGGMNVPARDGRFLHDLIVRNGYRRGLEIGTSNGYSTLWLGLAFRTTGGKVITVEIDEAAGREARENFRKAGLEGVIDSRIGDAFVEIPKITGEFDFVFLDAWKPDYVRFFKLLKDRIAPGGAFTAHNVTSQEEEMRDFIEAVRNDPAFETTFQETGRQGISVSIRRKQTP